MRGSKGRIIMSIKETILTTQGYNELKEELEQLKSEGRKDVADKIKVALSFGDLSENSEYDEAKSEQGKLEARINEIEAMLASARILDEDDTNDAVNVMVGSKVRVRDNDLKEEFVYHIVGYAQADPDEGRISDESPIGKSLIGHAEGDTVEVEVPSGVITFDILEIIKKK